MVISKTGPCHAIGAALSLLNARKPRTPCGRDSERTKEAE